VWGTLARRLRSLQLYPLTNTPLSHSFDISLSVSSTTRHHSHGAGAAHVQFEDDPFASEDLAAAEDLMAEVHMDEPPNIPLAPPKGEQCPAHRCLPLCH
jgi:hypothetical protein